MPSRAGASGSMANRIYTSGPILHRTRRTADYLRSSCANAGKVSALEGRKGSPAPRPASTVQARNTETASADFDPDIPWRGSHGRAERVRRRPEGVDRRPVTVGVQGRRPGRQQRDHRVGAAVDEQELTVDAEPEEHASSRRNPPLIAVVAARKLGAVLVLRERGPDVVGGRQRGRAPRQQGPPPG